MELAYIYHKIKQSPNQYTFLCEDVINSEKCSGPVLYEVYYRSVTCFKVQRVHQIHGSKPFSVLKPGNQTIQLQADPKRLRPKIKVFH